MTPTLGLLNLHKPPGMTSRAAVDHVQRLVRPAKAGHAGTLDPLASGVLVVCIGAATRLIEYVQQAEKRYEATFLLGRKSETEDVEAEVIELQDPPRPTRAELDAAAARFVGRIEQRPPSFSALKVDGRRAYDLARRGKPVELAPRPVTIYAVEMVEYAYPMLRIDVRCGAGTYVRSLGRDLAESLGTAAVMSALVRSAVGSFTLEESCKLEALTPESLGSQLLPARRAVEHLPAITLSPEEIERIEHGRAVQREAGLDAAAREFAAVDDAGNLLAVLERSREGLRPVRNLIGK